MTPRKSVDEDGPPAPDTPAPEGIGSEPLNRAQHADQIDELVAEGSPPSRAYLVDIALGKTLAAGPNTPWPFETAGFIDWSQYPADVRYAQKVTTP